MITSARSCQKSFLIDSEKVSASTNGQKIDKATFFSA